MKELPYLCVQIQLHIAYGMRPTPFRLSSYKVIVYSGIGSHKSEVMGSQRSFHQYRTELYNGLKNLIALVLLLIMFTV